jgi:exodeoxyribonuclease III
VRIATWNVNSLKARLDKVLSWSADAAPDILLLQETKLADEMAPVMPFQMAGYELVHHGEGRWNGVAIASRFPIDDVEVNFGDGPVRPGRAADDEPQHEARMLTARSGKMRIVSLYGPNGRVVGSSFYQAKLDWFARLGRWLEETRDPEEPLVLGGDLNVAPTDLDVWDPLAAHGGTHVSGPERAAFERLLEWGLVDAYRVHHPEGGRYTWWDYRAGHFHKGYGMRIDHLLVTRPVAERLRAAEIDRDARKNPTPSDHAPLVIDLGDRPA